MNQERYRFSLKTELPETLPIAFFQNTFQDLQSLLSKIEYARTGDLPHADWQIETDGIYITASANGVSSADLEGILTDTYAGFKANEYGDEEDWPDTFDEDSRQIVRRIIQRVKKTSPAVIETVDRAPLRIEVSPIAIHRRKQYKYAAWSSLEGRLDVISVHRSPYFVIYEHGENKRVRCTFPDDWTRKVIDMLGKRVIVEGYIHYRQSGEPYYLAKPTSLEEVPLPESDILALRGTVRGITGSLSSYDYVQKLRESDEPN